MKKIAKHAIALSTILFCIGANATSIPNTDDPNTFLGPTLKGRYTAPVNPNTAFSFLGEAGLRNLRAGATLGWKIDAGQRFKLSIEALRQKITYGFFSGNSNQWMNQWAIGAAYQYDFVGYSFDPAFDINAYYSHAPSKTLSTKIGRFINRNGFPRTFTDQRRVAGSNAIGIAPGVSISPWTGGRAQLYLNYDDVNYDNKYISDHDANGFGGTLSLDQVITDHVVFGISAAVRQPYNEYTAKLGWQNLPYYGGAWSVGIDGGYTLGKETLPNTWNLGLTFDYLLEPCPVLPANLKGEASSIPVRDPFWSWSAKPAVYMPQVLAIVDERVRTAPFCLSGTAPSVVTGIADVAIIAPDTVSVPTAQAFGGNNLTFSVAATPDVGNTVTIDPATGVITILATDTDNFDVTVTASNDCGTTSTTFNVDIEEEG